MMFIYQTMKIIKLEKQKFFGKKKKSKYTQIQRIGISNNT